MNSKRRWYVAAADISFRVLPPRGLQHLGGTVPFPRAQLLQYDDIEA